MTSNVAVVPTSGDLQDWTADQKALMEFAGLVSKVTNEETGEVTWMTAPASIVTAFAAAVNSTGLNPMVRQIYAVEFGGKWMVFVGIDGFRVIAQRTGEYRGQTPVQWTDGVEQDIPLMQDGKYVIHEGQIVTVKGLKWVDAWTADGNPAAARVGVYREGFKDPIYTVAHWTGYGKTSGNWKNNGPHMLGIRAEAIALKKAFPMELSNLFEPAEMDTMGETLTEKRSTEQEWLDRAKDAKYVEDVRDIYGELRLSAEYTDRLGAKVRAAATGKPNRPTEPASSTDPNIVDADVVTDA